jgi:predicted Zn-ribbon and HTH transcriptional regulator
MEEQKFHCSNCGYKFLPKNPESIPENCPYCNKPETLERAKSAQDMLDDLGGEIQEQENRDS